MKSLTFLAVAAQLVGAVHENYKGPHDFSIKSAPRPRKLVKRGTGEATLQEVSDYGNSQSIIPVTLGGQEQLVMIDTGAGKAKPRNAQEVKSGSPPDFYDESKSSTITTIPNSKWSMQFISQTVSGHVVKDDLVWGGMPISQAYVYPCEDGCGDGDYGNFGFAYGFNDTFEINGVTQTVPTIWQMLSKDLSSDLFAISFTDMTDQDYGTSTWMFGHVDPSTYTGDIVYSPVTNEGWQIEFSKYQISGQSVVSNAQLGFGFDTGNPGGLQLPSDLVKTYFSAITGSSLDGDADTGSYSAPCDETWPDYSFWLGDAQMTIPGDKFKARPITPGGTCSSNLSPGEPYNDRIYGMGMLITQVFTVVFSYENGGQMGFAKKASSSGATQGSASSIPAIDPMTPVSMSQISTSSPAIETAALVSKSQFPTSSSAISTNLASIATSSEISAPLPTMPADNSADSSTENSQSGEDAASAPIDAPADTPDVTTASIANTASVTPALGGNGMDRAVVGAQRPRFCGPWRGNRNGKRSWGHVCDVES